MENAKGIDVSSHNAGSIANMMKVLDFAIVRASVVWSKHHDDGTVERGQRADDSYARHSAATLKAGKVLGAYHFAGYGPGPTAQAQLLLRVARNASFLVVDVEGEALKYPKVMRGIIANLHKLDPQRRLVGLYSSDGTWPGDLGQDFDWPAHWEHLPGRPWRFWQTDNGGGKLDHDEYHGTVAQLRAWAATRRP